MFGAAVGARFIGVGNVASAAKADPPTLIATSAAMTTKVYFIAFPPRLEVYVWSHTWIFIALRKFTSEFITFLDHVKNMAHYNTLNFIAVKARTHLGLNEIYHFSSNENYDQTRTL